jgi:uncharacterized protein (TIGR03086 family)
MDLLMAVDDAHALARRRVGEITPENWNLSTPCDEWDVGRVAIHMINVMVLYDALLTDRYSPELLESVLAIERTPDTIGPMLEDASRQLRARLTEPGMLTKAIPYPWIEGFDGSKIACFSIIDTCVHSWDIAQALGVDGTFSEDLAQIGYDGAAPYNDIFQEVGFTKPPTAAQPADNSAQARLLHLFGRC